MNDRNVKQVLFECEPAEVGMMKGKGEGGMNMVKNTLYMYMKIV
jgi:hypothetical protein